MTETRRFCKDCKHFVPSPMWGSTELKKKYALCAKSFCNPVTGYPEVECGTRRSIFGLFACGPWGTDYEPAAKEPS
jgi:hypothetical protein